ncbi:hypothetical protein CL620_03575 [archaeon]|jgi:hypothetical protein|nr:hypothetical protein [archaeon]
MRKEFAKVRVAVEEHLAAINENTAEIQALFDYLHEMDVKLEKVSQRLDSMQLGDKPKKDIRPLNTTEKQVFLLLYTQRNALNWDEMAEKTVLPLAVIKEAVSGLVSKGIPLCRSYVDDMLYFKLEPSFKEMQAKENLVNLSLESFI